MYVNLIVASSQNGVIGKDGNMPWYIPQDLKRFKELTTDSIVIMGRKTFDSIGKKLPNRYNFVLSSNNTRIVGAYLFKNINLALNFAKLKMPECNVFVIGGASVYKQFIELGLVNRIYQTIVEEHVDGDALFSFDESTWKLTEEIHETLKNKDGKPINCAFLTWEKN